MAHSERGFAMILRSIPITVAVLLVILTLVAGNYGVYPNDLPNRWDFPSTFRYTASIDEQPSMTDIIINVTMTLADGNTPVVFPQYEEISYLRCGLEIIADDQSMQFIRAWVDGKDTDKLVFKSKLPSPISVSRITLLCRGLSILRPTELDIPAEAAAVLAVTIADGELGTVHSEEIDLTIRDLPSINHIFHWGGKKGSSAEILVIFNLYLPSTFSPLIQYIDLDHPLLDVNSIDSMHLPHGANRLEDLTRLYNILHDSAYFDEVFPCKDEQGRTLATINFIRSDQIEKVHPRITFTNRDNVLSICSFEIPYPPDVLHSILGSPQSKQVHMIIDDPDSKERVTIASVPIDYPHMIPSPYVFPGKQPYLWYSAIHTQNVITEFEIGISTTDRDIYYEASQNSRKIMTFSIVNAVFEYERIYRLEEWSPVMACREHNEIEYPNDVPLIDGRIEVRSDEFGGFGKTCRFRLLRRPTDTRGSWWLVPDVVPAQRFAPQFTLFNPMHQMNWLDTPRVGIILHEAVQDKNHQTSFVATMNSWNTTGINPFPLDVPRLAVNHHYSQEDSSVPPMSFRVSENLDDIQPIPFTKYTEPYGSSIRHYANATIDMKYLLPFDQPFSTSGMMLAIIFAGRNTIDSGMLPDPTFPSFSIAVKSINKFPTYLTTKIYVYNFNGVLDQHHRDPIESVIQNARPLRAPVVRLYPSQIPMEFKSGKTYEMTIIFEISEKFDVENEPIYLTLVSPLDLETGRFTTRYAHITLASHQHSKFSIGTIIGIVIGSLIGVAVALSIIWCHRNRRACFHQKSSEEYDDNTSNVYQEL